MKKLFKHVKNPKVFRTFLTIIGIIVVLAGVLYYEFTHSRVFIDNSLVDAPITTIAPSRAGILTEMDAYEGELVKKGDALGVVSGQTIHTDTDGLIIQANNQLGSSVNPQSTLVQLINLSNMRIAGTIDENKGLNDIHVGQVASFTVDALPGKTFWDMTWRLGLFAMGLGIGLSPLTNAATSTVPIEEVGIASSVLALARNLAGAFGVAIFATILSNSNTGSLIAIQQHSVVNTTDPALLKLISGLMVTKANVLAYGIVFKTSAIMVGLGAISIVLERK